MFKTKAIEIADKLMPAFNTPTGIPMAMVNVRTYVCCSFIYLGLRLSYIENLLLWAIEREVYELYLCLLCPRPVGGRAGALSGHRHPSSVIHCPSV